MKLSRWGLQSSPGILFCASNRVPLVPAELTWTEGLVWKPEGAFLTFFCKKGQAMQHGLLMESVSTLSTTLCSPEQTLAGGWVREGKAGDPSRRPGEALHMGQQFLFG